MKFTPKPTSYKQVEKPCYKCKHTYWASQYDGMDGPYCIYGMKKEEVPPDSHDGGELGMNGKRSYMDIKMDFSDKIMYMAIEKYGEASPKPFKIISWLTQFLEKGWREWGSFADSREVARDGTCDFWEQDICG